MSTKHYNNTIFMDSPQQVVAVLDVSSEMTLLVCTEFHHHCFVTV